MPGRQAHGRALISNPAAKTQKKSKARSQKNALNAFGIAQEHFPARLKRTPRVRELEAEAERKHGRDEDDEDDEEEDEAPKRKKAKPVTRTGNDDVEYGSDSEGNEWRLGGLAEGDEDSEIESDDAFGDSDKEKFQDFTFKGSKTSKVQDDDSEDDSQDDEGETLGNDAIDLATALDQYEETSEEEEADGSGSEEADSADDASDESESADEDSEDEEAEPEQLDALKGLIAGFGGGDDEGDENQAKQKISLGDLGLAGLNDPLMKKSVNLMKKEQKENRPGAAKKLAVPLARRQQGRLDRSAAYDKTNETLDRWTETVKHNRRAEHLIFPLPQNSSTAGMNTHEIQPLTAKNASNELESTIMSIMEQSGLSMEKPTKPKEVVYDEEGNAMSRKEIQNMKRMERELNSREAKRAKRIKKIKSKSYHRVHRKQRERAEMAEKEAMEEAGELDSEEEREAQDRRRALERVGQRHKESKWAKIGAKAKRAVWDENFRAGLTEMARKSEELRRRKEGKDAESGSDSDSSAYSDEDDDAALRRQLDKLEDLEDSEPQSKLMALKFMRNAEEARKKRNDEEIKTLRKMAGYDDGEDSESESEGADEVGRKEYGAPGGKPFQAALDTSDRVPKKNRLRDEVEETNLSDGDDAQIIVSAAARPEKAVENGDAWSRKRGPLSGPISGLNAPHIVADTSDRAAASHQGAWSTDEPARKKKGSSNARTQAISIDSVIAARPRKPIAAAPKRSGHDDDDGDSDSDSDNAEQHMPLTSRDRELIAKTFAGGDDAEAEFRREKEDVADADDDKVIDNTLPGWGSWVGDGVSNREKKRHQGRFLTKVEGIKKKDRKDAKLEKVIINEKRIKKNDRYLASQLPHPFESREQYERSLRLPVGPEWSTKETFQESTKPRVIMKQGVIAPMSKPMI